MIILRPKGSGFGSVARRRGFGDAESDAWDQTSSFDDSGNALDASGNVLFDSEGNYVGGSSDTSGYNADLSGGDSGPPLSAASSTTAIDNVDHFDDAGNAVDANGNVLFDSEGNYVGGGNNYDDAGNLKGGGSSFDWGTAGKAAGDIAKTGLSLLTGGGGNTGHGTAPAGAKATADAATAAANRAAIAAKVAAKKLPTWVLPVGIIGGIGAIGGILFVALRRR